MMRAGKLMMAAAAVIVFATACASRLADSNEQAPSVEDTLAGQGTITVPNADGTWTATANQPAENSSGVYGSASFTGPAGKTRKMGVCLLERYEGQYGTVQCGSVADCASAPPTLPAGGARYCVKADDDTALRCYYRPGSQTSLCAGSPAKGGVAVPPGTYTTPASAALLNGTITISDACFEGCSVTDPSVSSSMWEAVTPPDIKCMCNGRLQVCPCMQ